MDNLKLFKKAGKVVTKFIEGIEDDQWEKLSVDAPWTVRDLVNHLTSEILWVPPLVEGKIIAEVDDKFDGDVLGDDPVKVFKEALKAAEQAYAAAGALKRKVHLSYGDFPAPYYCGLNIEELTIHGWDIAVSTKQKDDLPEDLVNKVWEVIKEDIEDWRRAGVLGQAIKVSDTADSQTKLLAALGRDRQKYSQA